MKLLENFTPPTPTRVVWHSLKAQREFQPLFNRASNEWNDAEREAVRRGFRKVCLQPIQKGFQYAQLEAYARNHGLFVRPVRQVGYFSGFAHRYTSGDDMWVTAIASDIDALQNPEEGLGYPQCCQDAFASNFPAFPDPVWQWANATENPDDFTTVQLRADPHLNPVLRYVGLRLSPHIPCSYHCASSIIIGKKMGSCLSPEVYDFVKSILSGPVTWDCYRGIAIVLTEHFRVVVGSNAATVRHLVHVNQNKELRVLWTGQGT